MELRLLRARASARLLPPRQLLLARRPLLDLAPSRPSPSALPSLASTPSPTASTPSLSTRLSTSTFPSSRPQRKLLARLSCTATAISDSTAWDGIRRPTQTMRGRRSPRCSLRFLGRGCTPSSRRRLARERRDGRRDSLRSSAVACTLSPSTAMVRSGPGGESLGSLCRRVFEADVVNLTASTTTPLSVASPPFPASTPRLSRPAPCSSKAFKRRTSRPSASPPETLSRSPLATTESFAAGDPSASVLAHHLLSTIFADLYRRSQHSEGLLGFDGSAGSALTQLKPVALKNIEGHTIVQLATGDDHFVALTSEGKVFACGNGEQCQLGRKIIQRASFRVVLLSPPLSLSRQATALTVSPPSVSPSRTSSSSALAPTTPSA